jgi:hypothetical protein
VSYVSRAARAVAAEGLPLLLADANGDRSSEAADWALSRAGGVRYVRAPHDAIAARVDEAARARDARRVARVPPRACPTRADTRAGYVHACVHVLRSRIAVFRTRAPSAGVASAYRASHREQELDLWRWKESADWAWAVAAAVQASDATHVLYLEDDVVLAAGAADAMAARVAEWTRRGGGAADVAPTVAAMATAPRPPPPPPARLSRRAPRAPPPPADDGVDGWMGLSLWSADDLPDGTQEPLRRAIGAGLHARCSHISFRRCLFPVPVPVQVTPATTATRRRSCCRAATARRWRRTWMRASRCVLCAAACAL